MQTNTLHHYANKTPKTNIKFCFGKNYTSYILSLINKVISSLRKTKYLANRWIQLLVESCSLCLTLHCQQLATSCDRNWGMTQEAADCQHYWVLPHSAAQRFQDVWVCPLEMHGKNFLNIILKWFQSDHPKLKEKQIYPLKLISYRRK